MNKLPVELLIKILNLLDLKNRLKCRQLSKEYLNIIDNFIVNKKLLIIDRSDTAFNVLFPNNRSVSQYTVISTWCNNCFLVRDYFKEKGKFFDLSFLLKNRYFKNLKKLSISLGYLPIDLDILNHFNRLEILNIKALSKKKGTFLTLPNLRKLSIEVDVDDDDQAVISAPNLRFLQGNVKFKEEPENLEEIRYMEFGLILKNLEIWNYEFRKLQNLKYLQIRLEHWPFYKYSLALENSNKNAIQKLLFNLPNLKVLNLVFTCVAAYIFNYNQFLNDIESHSKIYINGISLKTYLNQIAIIIDLDNKKDRRTINDKILEFYLSNHSSLYSILNKIFSLNYSSCEKYFSSNKVSSVFLKKLEDLRSVKVFNKIDKKQFLNTLLNLQLVHTLKFTNSEFDQDFYSNLNKYVPYLDFIKIKDKKTVIENLDFSFLESFKSLTRFDIESPLSYKVFPRFTKEIKSFKVTIFFFNEDDIQKSKKLNTSFTQNYKHLSVHHASNLYKLRTIDFANSDDSEDQDHCQVVQGLKNNIDSPVSTDSPLTSEEFKNFLSQFDCLL